MHSHLPDTIEAALGKRPTSLTALTGGDIARVFRIRWADGSSAVLKLSGQTKPDLTAIEVRMLNYLKSACDLPVPAVLFEGDGFLIMEDLGGTPGLSGRAEREAGRQTALLHLVHAQSAGLDFDTVIGPLHQPNDRADDWVTFFRDRRLLYMADLAYRTGRLPIDLRKRLDQLARRLDRLIPATDRQSLLHGDLWGGNVLADGARLSGFIDPAIYYGHREMDLAFITLFGSVGQAFFDAYKEIYPVEPGFFEVRRDLYNLWPLLVHVTLFGGGYVAKIEHSLIKLGD